MVVSVANLERMVREDLSEKGTFEQRAEGSGKRAVFLLGGGGEDLYRHRCDLAWHVQGLVRTMGERI